MTSPTRVFVVEQDLPSLLMLTLWLEQFEEIDVVGSAMARADLLQLIEDSRPDVVIYDWPMTSRTLPSLVKHFRDWQDSPAMVCIRNGNFLQLECTQNMTPESIIPSTASADELLESIHRAARKLRESGSLAKAG